MQDTFTLNGKPVAVIQQPQIPTWRVKDVARLFQVGEGAVYRWIQQGKLPYHLTLGGHYRFVEAEVRAAQLKREAE